MINKKLILFGIFCLFSILLIINSFNFASADAYSCSCIYATWDCPSPPCELSCNLASNSCGPGENAYCLSQGYGGIGTECGCTCGTSPPPVRYRCDNGACMPGNTGEYESRAACQAECEPLPPICDWTDYADLDGDSYCKSGSANWLVSGACNWFTSYLSNYLYCYNDERNAPVCTGGTDPIEADGSCVNLTHINVPYIHADADAALCDKIFYYPMACPTGSICQTFYLLSIPSSKCVPQTCTPTTWTPNPSIVCSGQTFTQTSNCGTTRTSTGTKQPECPSASMVQCGQQITSTNGCGTCSGTGTYCASGTCQNGVCAGQSRIHRMNVTVTPSCSASGCRIGDKISLHVKSSNYCSMWTATTWSLLYWDATHSQYIETDQFNCIDNSEYDVIYTIPNLPSQKLDKTYIIMSFNRQGPNGGAADYSDAQVFSPNINIVSTPVDISACAIINGQNYCCGQNDSVCPSDFENITGYRINCDSLGIHDYDCGVAGNNLPQVSIEQPFNNAYFLPGSTIQIAVDASDPDIGDSIAEVELIIDNIDTNVTILTTFLSLPAYGYTWTNAPAGNYTITAYATDTRGGSASASVIIHVATTIPTQCQITNANVLGYCAGGTTTKCDVGENITLNASFNSVCMNVRELEIRSKNITSGCNVKMITSCLGGTQCIGNYTINSISGTCANQLMTPQDVIIYNNTGDIGKKSSGILGTFTFGNAGNNGCVISAISMSNNCSGGKYIGCEPGEGEAVRIRATYNSAGCGIINRIKAYAMNITQDTVEKGFWMNLSCVGSGTCEGIWFVDGKIAEKFVNKTMNVNYVQIMRNELEMASNSSSSFGYFNFSQIRGANICTACNGHQPGTCINDSHRCAGSGASCYSDFCANGCLNGICQGVQPTCNFPYDPQCTDNSCYWNSTKCKTCTTNDPTSCSSYKTQHACTKDNCHMNIDGAGVSTTCTPGFPCDCAWVPDVVGSGSETAGHCELQGEDPNGGICSSSVISQKDCGEGSCVGNKREVTIETTWVGGLETSGCNIGTTTECLACAGFRLLPGFDYLNVILVLVLLAGYYSYSFVKKRKI